MVADGEWTSVEMSRKDCPPGQVPLIHKGHVQGFNTSLPLINDLTILTLLAKARPRVEIRHNKGELVNKTIANTISWSLTVSFQTPELTALIPKPIECENSYGRKYCLTVQGGTFLARRSPRFGVDNLGNHDGSVSLESMSPFFTGNCQMGKQTMGTPVHNLRHRTDNKMYRIQSPQRPIVRNELQDAYLMDAYPNGTNAVVAVISYTGYDMEDAMILNKSSVERGFGHGSVYKTKTVTACGIEDRKKSASQSHKQFTNTRGEKVVDGLDEDGMPFVGTYLKKGDPIASSFDPVMNKQTIEKHKDNEGCFVESVRKIDTQGYAEKAKIMFRYNRNPIVGDKFSSRHGQKGVLSVKWPQEDMPFTESGMTPDIIINPHAFPSRMTIGMLIESMAGKSGALHGIYQDSTPFKRQGDVQGQTAVDYFGKQLREAGYNYYGSEPLYSGIQGTPLRADIFIGVVYYQRLRHMVSDKSQVRSTGPVDPLTRQPVKGRKKHGGVRFGEMERDSLISHGVAYLMQDRMLNCSDRHTAIVCCGSLMSTHHHKHEASSKLASAVAESIDSFVVNKPRSGMDNPVKCRLCDRSDQWKSVTIPYVVRYLANEMVAMGIKLDLQV